MLQTIKFRRNAYLNNSFVVYGNCHVFLQTLACNFSAFMGANWTQCDHLSPPNNIIILIDISQCSTQHRTIAHYTAKLLASIPIRSAGPRLLMLLFHAAGSC